MLPVRLASPSSPSCAMQAAMLQDQWLDQRDVRSRAEGVASRFRRNESLEYQTAFAELTTHVARTLRLAHNVAIFFFLPMSSICPTPAGDARKTACAVSRTPLSRKWRRTDYFQRLRSGSRNIAGRTLGHAAAAATGQLCFSTRNEVLDYEYH
jgi:hypothetical protein